MSCLLPWLPLAHGAFYLATGLWPLFSMKTFEAVTGPKTDRWLVKTVGVLVAVIGTVILASGIHEKIETETIILALGSAAGLVGIDVWYVAKRVISPIYLIDAVVELLLVALWLVVL